MRSILLVLAACAAAGAAERINHAGRILGPAPTVGTPTLFNTPEADAIVAAMQIMPRDNPWNEDISGLATLYPRSSQIMAQIRSDVVAINSNRNTLRVFAEMNYVLVPPAQGLVNVKFLLYADESDLNGGTLPVGRYPIPGNLPIEGWPSERPGESLSHAQTHDDGGDRHAVAVMPEGNRFYEIGRTVLTSGSPAWTGACGAIFPLDSNALRPDTWTSTDAAGLPLFPALIRYDECERGTIEHALRLVVNKSLKSHIWPATHDASNITAGDYPPMGLRIRLKPAFAIPGGWSKQSKAVAQALKTYGGLVADNGGFFSVSACPDDRFPTGCFDDVQTIDIDQFEAVLSTGETGGPRSSGAPTADAGSDQSVTVASGADLAGTVGGSGTTIQWSLYDVAHAPGTASFTPSAAVANPHVAFSAAGTYTLMLKVSDGTHTPAYDALVVTVLSAPNPVPTLASLSPTAKVQNSGGFTLTVNGGAFAGNARITWSGQADLAAATATSSQLTVSVPASYLASAGVVSIAVVNPAPGGGTSSTQSFSVLADTTAPLISAAAVGAISDTAASVSWTTDEAATSRVDYGLTSGYGSTATVAGFATGHSVPLTGLAASTVYHYRITSTDAAGNPATTSDATFATTAIGGSGGSGGAAGGGGGGCGAGAAGLLALIGLLALRRRG